jgi:chromosome segregation protein
MLYGREGIALRSQAEDKVVEMFKAEMKKIEEEELLLNDSIRGKNDEIKKIAQKEEEMNKKLKAMLAPEKHQECEELISLGKLSEELRVKLDQLREEKERAQKIMEELENKPATAPSGTENLMREEINLAKLQGELLQLEDRVQGDYGMTREALLAQPLIADNVAKSKKEAEEIRSQLRALEPVNLLAIEEYEKIRERHSFIEGQYGDLVTARENLKTLIVELDAKASEDFNQTMEVITKNFKEIFANLFEGGEASIEVKDDEGIEISACPSGRKWLNLSLLSGGERSLTAIALLLSFLKTQPSPLCILDEVDAALDEANVARFARFIKDFSGKTQMIIISHNKRTMEAADIIYGITMEEPGISKVVSMRLAEAV